MEKYRNNKIMSICLDLQTKSLSYLPSPSYPCTIPNEKSGKHVLFMVWQRDDSQEAFYTWSESDLAYKLQKSKLDLRLLWKTSAVCVF